MSFRASLRRLCPSLKSAPGRRASKKSKVSLQLETLEDRLVPSLTFPAQYGAQGTSLGGDVRTGDVPVYLIFANNQTTGFGFDGSVTASQIQAAVTNILNSSYYSGLSEYGAATHAHVAGTFVSRYALPMQFTDGPNNSDINNLVSDS